MAPSYFLERNFLIVLDISSWLKKTKIENHPTHIALGSFLWTNFRWSEAKIEKLDVSRKDNIFDILAMNDSGNERKKQFLVYGGDVSRIFIKQDVIAR